MCVSPLSIPNPRIDFRPQCDNLYITVPCNHCDECVGNLRDDWTVRLYYEMKHFISIGGCVKFPTLTFNEQHIPIRDFSSSAYDFLAQYGDFPRFTFRTFDKDALMRFVRKVKKYLYRFGFTESENAIKVFVVCEYGDTYHRPHYHCLFFLPFQISDGSFKRILEHCWCHSVSVDEVPAWFASNAVSHFCKIRHSCTPRYYNLALNIYAPVGKGDVSSYLSSRDKNGKIRYFLKYGNVSFSDKYGGDVSTVEAISYVVSYLFSDVTYCSQPHICDMFKFSKSLPPLYSFPKDKIKLVRHVHDCIPFRLSSKGLGQALVSKYREHLATDYEGTLRVLADGKISFPSTTYLYSIPQYVINNLFYSSVDILRDDSFALPDGGSYHSLLTCKKRMLTPLGRECLALRFRLSLNSLSDYFKKVLNPSYLEGLKGFLYKPEFIDKYNALSRLYSTFDLSSVNYDLLSVYKLKYQNLLLTGYEHFRLHSVEDYISFAINLKDSYLDSYNVVDLCRENPAPCEQLSLYDKLPLFNNLDVFAGYDAILAYVSELKNFVNSLRSACKNRTILSQYLTNYINNLTYV